MTEHNGLNAVAVIGIVLLLVGGLGVVYGQLALQNQGGNTDGGTVLDVTVEDGGSENNDRLDQRRISRLVGLVVGIIGAVLAVVGGLIG